MSGANWGAYIWNEVNSCYAPINVNPVGGEAGTVGTFSNLPVLPVPRMGRFEFRPACSQVDVIYAHEQ
jgi:hypothetical protein